MEQEKRYHNNKLTLKQLATDLNISINHLSQVINSAFGVNFFEFINRYRIGEAKRLLSELPSQQGLILSIALSVGFSSSSTFYAAFKKHLGVTPSQYRRTHYKSNT
jgi:AraC-like DNA-binding protein